MYDVHEWQHHEDRVNHHHHVLDDNDIMQHSIAYAVFAWIPKGVYHTAWIYYHSRRLIK